jgi:hypothetical protein
MDGCPLTDRLRSLGVTTVWCIRMESKLSSTLHVWRVITSAFCITWPICVRKVRPASVYLWIGCLWRISGVRMYRTEPRSWVPPRKPQLTLGPVPSMAQVQAIPRLRYYRIRSCLTLDRVSQEEQVFHGTGIREHFSKWAKCRSAHQAFF